MTNIKKSQLFSVIKECLKDLIKNDKEVRALISETILARASNTTISESPVPHIDRSDPRDKELWDNILLLSEGRLKEVINNKKRLKGPNSGLGFKSPDNIKKWASAAYTKIGGVWEPKNIGKTRVVEEPRSSLPRSTNSQFMNENVVKGVNNIEYVDEQGNRSVIDFTEVMADTANTTMLKQLSGEGYGPPADGNAQIVSEASNVEELFGDQAVESWEKLAFAD